MTTPASLRHRLRNAAQSLLLLAAMAALAGYLGWALFGAAGLAWAAVLGPLFVALGQGVSPRLVLRLTGATPIAPPDAPNIYRILGALAQRAELPVMPRLYYVPSRVLNAFAAGGRNESAIAVTDGLLRAMSTRELTGILAHEVSHLRSNDVWVMTLADVVGRITGLLSVFGQLLLFVWVPLAFFTGSGFPALLPIAVLILAPTISALLQLALSRTREYDADIAAVELTGDPGGLAAALDKLERLQGGWIERMFMNKMPKWLKTHPSTHERIRRLLELEPARARARYVGEPYIEDPFFERPIIVRGPRWHWHGLWY